MSALSRLPRLFLIVLLAITLPTLYLLYPSNHPPPGSGDYVDYYQAGGIDGEHWRPPTVPNFSDEEGRNRVNTEDEQVRGWEDELVVGDGPSSDTLTVSVEGGVGAVIGSETGYLEGGVIMPKLENATAKAELGRAAWRVLHLMTLRFPEEPTPDDRQALKSFFHLFSRLYPCGECAAEFQSLLKDYPPQTSSQKSASLWLCHVHNLINERLGKPEFDCLTLDATYDCGCGDDASVSADATAAVTTGGAGLTEAAIVSKAEEVVRLGGGGSADHGSSSGYDED